MDFLKFPLIVTDGFDFYEKVVRRVFGPAALYGQVLKTRRNNRIVKVERRELMGASWRFEEVLNNSEDSSTLNTSFIERMNLTIRQGSAYLSRRTLSHARSEEKLEEHLELLRADYRIMPRRGGARCIDARWARVRRDGSQVLCGIIRATPRRRVVGPGAGSVQALYWEVRFFRERAL